MRDIAEIHTGYLGTRRTAWLTTGPHSTAEFALRNDDSPEVQVGQTVYVDYEPQDQYAKISVRPADVSAGGQWSKEHSSLYWVPKVVCDTLTDRSWHNDVAPSFSFPEDENGFLTLWVHHLVPELRDLGRDCKRFVVAWNPDGFGDPGSAPEYQEFDTDDCAEALGRMLAWRPRLAKVVPGPAVATAPAAPAVKLSGPRFILLVGAIREEYPDLPVYDEWPEDDGIICWDRQEQEKVFTLHPKYAQALCLEMIGENGPEGLCDWFNGLSDEGLESEGMPKSKQNWERPAREERVDRLFAACQELLAIVQAELADDPEPEDLPSWHRAIANAKAAMGQPEIPGVNTPTEPDAMDRLIKTVTATGGVVRHPDGTFGPLYDQDWIDLADAYLVACKAKGVAPLIIEQAESPIPEAEAKKGKVI